MLVLGWFDLRMRPAVDAELLVSQDVFFFGQIFVHLRPLGPEINILNKDAGARVLSPEEWRVGVAFTFHLILTIKAPQRAHL